MTTLQHAPYPLDNNTGADCWFISLFYCLESIKEYREDLIKYLPESCNIWRKCFAKYAELQTMPVRSRGRDALVITKLISTIGMNVGTQEDVQEGFMKIFGQLPDAVPTHCEQHSKDDMVMLVKENISKVKCSHIDCEDKAQYGVSIRTRQHAVIHRFLEPKRIVHDYKGDVSALTSVAQYMRHGNTFPDIPYFSSTQSEWFIPLEVKGDSKVSYDLNQLLNDHMWTTCNDEGYEYRAFNPINRRVTNYIVLADKTMQTIDDHYHRPPPIIPLYIKRFKYDMATGRRAKLNNSILFPLEHNFMTIFSPESIISNRLNAKDFRYELVAFIEHMGITAGGHYVAYVRRSSSAEGGDWFRCDNHHITLQSLDQIKEASTKAYMVFYRLMY